MNSMKGTIGSITEKPKTYPYTKLKINTTKIPLQIIFPSILPSIFAHYQQYYQILLYSFIKFKYDIIYSPIKIQKVLEPPSFFNLTMLNYQTKLFNLIIHEIEIIVSLILLQGLFMFIILVIGMRECYQAKRQGKVGRIDGRNWMSQLPDTRPITSLSLPGTHDSAAYKSPSLLHTVFTWMVWKTQDSSISEQLEQGIRFFDIRIKCEAGEKLSLCHGEVELGEFQSAIGPIVRFLRQERSQFVGLLFQKELGRENCKASGEKVVREIEELAGEDVRIFQHDWASGVIPCVRHLRGKLWLIQAYPGQKNRVDLPGNHKQIPTYCSTHILTDNKTYMIQNHWQGPAQLKKQSIKKVLSCPHPNILKFNFITQSNLPRFYACRYNRWFRELIQGWGKGQGQRQEMGEEIGGLGIVFGDFMGGGLIDVIIGTNF